MLDRKEVVLGNSEAKILWAIYEQLIEINKKLDKCEKDVGLVEKETISRIEIVEKIKSLPANKRPAGWTKKPSEVLVDFLEKEGLI